MGELRSVVLAHQPGMPIRTPGFARQRPWLGQVGVRGVLGAPDPVAAPQPTTVYPQYQLPKAEPGESQDVTNLAADGARLMVEIGVPDSVVEYYTSRGQTPPPKQTVRALIDSGASISGIKPAIAQAAGLIQTSSVGISGVVGSQDRPVYTAAMKLPDYNVSFDTMDIAGIDLPQQEIDVLIGRDVLKKTVFTYEGKFGTFSIQDGDAGLATPSTLEAGGVFIAAVAALILFA